MGLADGGQIVLDSAANGMITRQEGAQIIKSGSGLLEYKADKMETEKLVFNMDLWILLMFGEIFLELH